MAKLRSTETRYIESEVSWSEIQTAVKRKVYHELKFPGEYIKNGKWEIDHGGHGSGYQEVVREATDEEKKQYEALWLILKYLR